MCVLLLIFYYKLLQLLFLGKSLRIPFQFLQTFKDLLGIFNVDSFYIFYLL